MTTSDQAAASALSAQMATEIAVPSDTNAVTLLYGDSGTWKTNLASTYADYVWEESKRLYGSAHGKITLYAAADLGGWGSRMQAAIRTGIVRPYRARNHINPVDTVDKISLGYWPVKAHPILGEAAPDVPLIGPVRVVTRVWDVAGHLVATLPYKPAATAPPLQCPTCKLFCGPANWTAQTVSEPAPHWEKVGGLAIEGLISMSQYALEEMGEQAAQGKLEGQIKGVAGKMVSGDTTIGLTSLYHVGVAQQLVERWLRNSTLVAGLVAPVLWTTLEMRATDEGVTFYGPEIAGRARTGSVPQWVGNCLRTTIVGGQPRLYVKVHAFQEEAFVPHLCKARAALPYDYLADANPQTGEPLPPFTRFSLQTFFQDLKQSLEAEIRASQQAHPDAPGVTEWDLTSALKVAAPPTPPPAAPSVAPPMPPPMVPTPQVVVPKIAGAVASSPAPGGPPKVPPVPPVPPPVVPPVPPVVPQTAATKAPAPQTAAAPAGGARPTTPPPAGRRPSKPPTLPPMPTK